MRGTPETVTVTVAPNDDVRRMFDEATRLRTRAAADLRSLSRDIAFWDHDNPRFGLTSEQVEEVLRRIAVVVGRLDPPTEDLAPASPVG